jgi:hypothetical protein
MYASNSLPSHLGRACSHPRRSGKSTTCWATLRRTIPSDLGHDLGDVGALRALQNPPSSWRRRDPNRAKGFGERDTPSDAMQNAAVPVSTSWLMRLTATGGFISRFGPMPGELWSQFWLQSFSFMAIPERSKDRFRKRKRRSADQPGLRFADWKAGTSWLPSATPRPSEPAAAKCRNKSATWCWWMGLFTAG